MHKDADDEETHQTVPIYFLTLLLTACCTDWNCPVKTIPLSIVNIHFRAKITEIFRWTTGSVIYLPLRVYIDKGPRSLTCSNTAAHLKPVDLYS